MSKDPQYCRLIHASRWIKLRKEILAAQPFCVRCKQGGLLTLATEIHHTVPVETATTLNEKQALMYNVRNLMPLCHHCHVSIHMEMKKGTKQERIKRTKEQVETILNKFYK